MAAVMTRQNAVEKRLALVPAWDMCNHDRTAPASAVVLENGEPRLELRAATDLEGGEDVRMDYGTRSTLEFALYAGFLPPSRSPRDAVPLPVSLLVNDGGGGFRGLATNLLKKKLIPESGGDAVFVGQLVVVADGRVGPDDALRAIGLAAVVDKSRLAHLVRSADCVRFTPLDDDHAADAAAFLRTACDAELAKRAATNAAVLHNDGGDSSAESRRRRDLARALFDFEFDFLRDAATSLSLS